MRDMPIFVAMLLGVTWGLIILSLLKYLVTR
jgi:hypothetical protein